MFSTLDEFSVVPYPYRPALHSPLSLILGQGGFFGGPPAAIKGARCWRVHRTPFTARIGRARWLARERGGRDFKSAWRRSGLGTIVDEYRGMYSHVRIMPSVSAHNRILMLLLYKCAFHGCVSGTAFASTDGSHGFCLLLSRVITSEPSRADGPSALVMRNVSVRGHRTSIRLEPQIWTPWPRFAGANSARRTTFASYVAGHRPPHASLSSSLRVFILDYFRRCATEDGHRKRVGHGQGMFLSRATGAQAECAA